LRVLVILKAMERSKQFEVIKQEVLGRQKVLAQIFEKDGQKSIFEYVNGWKIGKSATSDIFINALSELLENTYSRETAEGAVNQLKTIPLVSSIDHHGILNHPFFVNSNLVFSLRKELKYLICLSTSGVSLNNSSYPSSFVYTSKDLKIERLSFFPEKMKMASVFSAKKIGRQEAEKTLKKVGNLNLDQAGKNKISGLINEVFLNAKVQNLENFSLQASAVSNILWKKFFPGAPEVLYVPVEDLASELICEIARDSKNIFHKLLFTKSGWELLEKHFNNISGSFISDKKGSFLFWGVDKKGRRVHLKRGGGRLFGENFEVFFEPETICKVLKQRQMYPTSLVCFLLVLYYGVTCLGGFNQVNWLTEIKNRFLELLSETGLEPESALKIANIETGNFAEANLAFGVKSGGVFNATGLDIFLSGKKYYLLIEEFSKQFTVSESVESLLPEIYKVITPAEIRQKFLPDFSESEVLKLIGAEEKIKKIFL
jgi:hypothetical protein